MNQVFSRDGLTFEYPAGWRLAGEEAGNGWTVTVQSPGAAFATVTLDRDMPDPREMVEAARQALAADYPTLEADAAMEAVGGELAVGHDIEFFSLDMVNSCRTRGFHGPAGTVLVLCQSTDADDEDHEPALRALVASMRSEED